MAYVPSPTSSGPSRGRPRCYSVVLVVPPPILVVVVRTVLLVVVVGCAVDEDDVDEVVDVVDSQTSVSIESPEQSSVRQQRWYSMSLPSTHRFARLLQTESRQPRRQIPMAQRSFAQRSAHRR